MSTIEQLKSFGKVKNSYAGLSTHDDIAVTVLFASHFFDNADNYLEWLDEWFEKLSYISTTEEDRNKINTILMYLDKYEYTKDDEQDDDDFSNIASIAA
jgi:predicted aldo/keto reductase-like oxidoreductase